MRGADSAYRKPLALGGATAFGAAIATWFVAIAVTDAVGPGSLELQAATGLLAIAVLLVVMNWFFHRVYWTGWIAHHNRRRQALVGSAGSTTPSARCSGSRCSASRRSTARASRSCCSCRTCGCATARASCSRASRSALVFVAAIGCLTFGLQRRLPYRKMLVATGVMLGRGAAGDGRRERAGDAAGRLDRDHAGERRDPGLDGALVRGLPQRADDRRAGRRRGPS